MKKKLEDKNKNKYPKKNKLTKKHRNDFLV
jgi:hypothetical protein